MSRLRTQIIASCVLLSLLLGLSFFAQAQIQIPNSLTQSDRESALIQLGPTAAPKVLSDPYPLGGYQGLEVSVTSTSIPTTELNRLGRGANNRSDVSVRSLSIGKGLYNSVDLFLSFAPATDGESVSAYAAQLRWTFFQGPYLPFYLTAHLHGSSVNYSNLVVTNTQGFDLLMSANVDDLTVSLGAGPMITRGFFARSISAGQADDQRETLQDNRWFFVANYRIEKWFLAGQLDRMTKASSGGSGLISSLAVGYRF